MVNNITNLYGAIAQLGERLLCTQEVGGSIPPGSTNFDLLVLLNNLNDCLAAVILLFNKQVSNSMYKVKWVNQFYEYTQA